jgi:hypothetical protein
VGRAAEPHTVGQQQRRRQQQQSGKEHNHSQAHEMQRARASGDPPMAKPKGNPKGKGKLPRGALDSVSAPTDESMDGTLTRVVQSPRCWQREAGTSHDMPADDFVNVIVRWISRIPVTDAGRRQLELLFDTFSQLHVQDMRLDRA